MKKYFLLLILAALLSTVAHADESGICGDNLTWTYYESSHSLVIAGSGDMYLFISEKDVPWYNFRGEIVSITLPQGVTSIGNYAFMSSTSLTSVTIPNSVTAIGNAAFWDCIGLTSFTIPNSVTSIGNYAFYNCSSLISVTIGKGVTDIGVSAFLNCSSLTSVTIPNSVKSIGGGSFASCSGLASIIVESGNNIYDSRNNCNAIIESNNNTLLFGCKNTVIPNSVTSIGRGAFNGCSGLTSVSIPQSVTSIGDNAFNNCSGLSAVYISDLAAWCNLTFSYNYNNPLYYAHTLYLNGEEIKDLIIPNNVTTIGKYVFNNCSVLNSVTIGNNVTSVGNGAFQNCSNLTSVTSLNPQPPVCQTGTFSDYTIPLYVPQGSTLKYKAAEEWRNFVIIRELGEADDIYLTINDGANGNVEIKVDKENPYLTLRFKPENGWRVYSVTLNGENVTDEIDSYGAYTTPAINGNSQLTVVYAQSSSSAPSLENAQLHFSSTDHSIVINGTVGGERISVCSIDGKSIANVVASGYTTEIPVSGHQVYLIKINNSVFKVSM